MFLLEKLIDFVSKYSEYFLWLTIGSGVLFVAMLLFVPLIIGSIPDDYFEGEKSPRYLRKSNYLFDIILNFIRNSIGFLLIVLGVLMLILPGQGILTIFVGILLMNFPGKYRLEKWLLSQPQILKMVNWIRKKRGKSTFTL